MGRLHRLADAAAAPVARCRRRRSQYAALGSRTGRSDRAVSPALRRQDVHRAIPGPRPRAGQDFRKPRRTDLRCVHAQAGSTPRRDPEEQPIAGVGASPRLNLAFPQMIANYDAKHDPRTPILSPEEKKVFVDTFTKTGFTGGINWYRN